MFCTKCGKQIPDSTKFCPYCGANCSPEQDIASQASQVFNKAEQELGSAFNEVKQSFTGSNNQNNNQGYNANQNYSNGYNNGTIPPYCLVSITPFRFKRSRYTENNSGFMSSFSRISFTD
jgi:hypothetical protein